MIENICPKCYAELTKIDSGYFCEYCKHSFQSDKLTNVDSQLKKVIQDNNLEIVQNLMQKLVAEVTAKYKNSENIIRISYDILTYMPDNKRAQFYEIANSRTDEDIADFITNNQFDEIEAEEIIDWLIESLSTKLYSPLVRFVTRNITDKTKRQKYIQDIDNEYNEIINGRYITTLERDVFVAYSGKDINRVDDIVKFLEHDIQDKTFIRYIVRFLKSGYMEDMKYYESDKGTPQGGLISPILANVYLHYVLDRYFEEIIKPKLKGEAYLVRYADDFLIMFQNEEEARFVYHNLHERFEKFGLEMEESKTRIIPFGRFKGTKDTFDFLGFMHYNGITRTGKYTVGHKMSKKKKKQKKESIKKYIKENRHKDIIVVIRNINKKLAGMFAYYGINGMINELENLKQYTIMTMYMVYRKRSQRNKLNFQFFNNILKIFPLSKPKIYHNIWI